MIDNFINYRGYCASVDVDFKENEFYGRLEGIRDFVDFISDAKEGIPGIIREFHSAVDDYIEFCHEHDEEPNVPEFLPELEYAM